MKKKARFLRVCAFIAVMVFFASAVAFTVKRIQFERNCSQYLKRAADASTIETAKEELGKAISYAEANNLTEGDLSIFFYQPKNDIGYWYRNLKEAYNELENLPADATSLEKTNVLMKLRETLTDDTDSGVSVTKPPRIELYPNHVFHFWWELLSGTCSVVLLIISMVA